MNRFNQISGDARDISFNQITEDTRDIDQTKQSKESMVQMAREIFFLPANLRQTKFKLRDRECEL